MRLSRLRPRLRHLFRPRNTFDFSLLEPGDLVLVANPTDPWLTQAAVFWSHVAIYVGDSEEHAFVDAVNLPIPIAGRRRDQGLPWQKVRFTSLRMFRSYVDVLVLRPPLPAAARRAAAEWARAQVGKPFPRRVAAAFFRPRARRGGVQPAGPVKGAPAGAQAAVGQPASAAAAAEPAEFTCSSLVWHAYLAQGLDLSSGPLGRWLVPWPSLLGHDRRLIHVGRGTRLRPLRLSRGHAGYWLARAWFRWALRSDVSWRGEDDPPSAARPGG